MEKNDNKHDSRFLVSFSVFGSTRLFALKLRVQISHSDSWTSMFQFDRHQRFHEYRKIQFYTFNFMSSEQYVNTTRDPQDPSPIHHTE